MKKTIFKVVLIALMTVNLACEKEEVNREELLKTKNTTIYLDDKIYEVKFSEQSNGNVEIISDNSDFVSNFIEDNKNATLYEDGDVIRIYSNEELLDNYLKEKFKSEKKSNKSVYLSKTLGTPNVGQSSLAVYQHSNFLGNSLTYVIGSSAPSSVEVSNLAGNNFNDEISSLEMRNNTPSPSYLASKVTFYQHSNYNGYSLVYICSAPYLNPGYTYVTNLNSVRMYRRWFRNYYWNDQISSLKFKFI